MRRIVVWVSVAVGCAVPRPETGAAASGADLAEIRATRAASNAAIARRDAAATVASTLPTYRVLPAGAPATLSRDSMHASLERQFADSAMLGYVRTPTMIDVSATSPTAAESGRWVGRRRRPDGVQETAGSYFAAWRRTPEGWRLQVEAFVALSCTGSVQCTPVR
jgi:ketosteroid isomerase-like protein